jgi:hypothetical protein
VRSRSASNSDVELGNAKRVAAHESREVRRAIPFAGLVDEQVGALVEADHDDRREAPAAVERGEHDRVVARRDRELRNREGERVEAAAERRGGARRHQHAVRPLQRDDLVVAAGRRDLHCKVIV